MHWSQQTPSSNNTGEDCTSTSPDGQHRNQIYCILCSQRWRSSTESTKTRLGNDSGSEHQLLFIKFILQLKKVEKTARPFRQDLNQIPYNYTVDVTNRFKELDLIECLKNYGRKFITSYRRWLTKIIPKKNKYEQEKWLSEEALQVAEKRREVKGKEEEKRYTHLNAEFQRIQQGGIRNPSSVTNAKKQRKTLEWERLETSSRKLGTPRELLHAN